MNQFATRLFSTEAYPSPITKNRAQMLYTTLTIIVLLYTAYLLFVPEWVTTLPNGEVTAPITAFQAITQGTASPILVGSVIVLYTLSAAAWFSARIGRLTIASSLVLALWYVGGVLLTTLTDDALVSAGLPMVVLIVMSALLFGERSLLPAFLLVVVTLFIAFYLIGGYDDQPTALYNMTTMLMGASAMMFLFLRYFRLSISEGVNEVIDERVRTADILTALTALLAERSSSERLVNAAVQHITATLPYVTRASLYLINEDGAEARLVAGSTPEDQRLIGQDYVVGVGGLTTVGQALMLGSPLTNRTDSGEAEAVFPLRVGRRTIGGLHLFSTTRSAFSAAAIADTLQALADNIALVLDNASQYERAETRLQENERLVEQARQAYREVERLNQRLTGAAWLQYLRTPGNELGMTYDFATDTTQPAPEWTPTLSEAVRVNHMIQEQGPERQVVAVPLRVRGQVIGAMEFELDGSQEFTPEDLDMVQEVSERFGMAAENTRLVLESQRVAQREALVNQISARLQTTNNVRTTLFEAARSLREALKADRVAIRLGTP